MYSSWCISFASNQIRLKIDIREGMATITLINTFKNLGNF